MPSVDGAEKSAPILFDISLSKARQVLLESPRARDYLAYVDQRLELFKQYINEEMSGLYEDAVEIAFLRVAPEVIGGTLPGGNDEESDEHDFESKDHCDACSDYWWENHNLSECIKYSQEFECNRHNDHAGAKCSWTCSIHLEHEGEGCAWKCSVHQQHLLIDCAGTCNFSHDDSEWHEYVEGMSRDLDTIERHNELFPICTMFLEQEA